MKIKDSFSWFANWALTMNPHPFMVILGAFTATWGAWLIMPWTHTFSSSPIYDTMAHVAPESLWGLVLLIIGIGQIYHATRRIHRASIVIAIASATTWSFIFTAFLVSARLTTGIPVYGWVTIWNAFLAYRIRSVLNQRDERENNGKRSIDQCVS